MTRFVKLSAISAPLVLLIAMSFALPARAGCIENCSTRQTSCTKRCKSVGTAQSPTCVKACDERFEKCKGRCSATPQSTSLLMDESVRPEPLLCSAEMEDASYLDWLKR